VIAALYVDPRGPYPRMQGVDCWDAARDARRYAGPWPVVAHPPCGPWGCLKHLYRGSEHDCAPRAVEQVRAHGGVLEHPAHSRLWRHARLPEPGELPDERGGYTLAVNQVDWGHVARKPTWLYLVGVPRVRLELPEPGEPTHWIGGSRGRGRERTRQGAPIPSGLKAASAQQRRRTPPAFAEWLVSLARSARVSEAA
jgi:hypothetical protein